MSDENQNENTAPAADQKAEEKAQVEKAINESRKTTEQELAEIVRYPALKFIIRFAKVMAITFAILFVIIAIVMFISGWFLEGLVNFILFLSIGVVLSALTWCFGDFFQLLIDIEENGRKNIKK